MKNWNSMDEEDEDVIVEGSALHKHLCNSGYTDFESVSINKKTPNVKFKFFHIDFKNCTQYICKKLYSLYSWITQEQRFSEQQMSILMDTKVLLKDHAKLVGNRFEKDPSNNTRKYYLKLIMTPVFKIIVSFVTIIIPLSRILHPNFLFGSSIILTSTCGLLYKRYKFFNIICASAAAIIISYQKYKRISSMRHLKSVIILQNNLFNVSKKVLKILRYGYKLKLSRINSRQQFSELGTNRLCFLQSMTEMMVTCLEHMPNIYHKLSIILLKILPENTLYEDCITKFGNESFYVRGEITYHELNEMFHTYVLTQSEFLCLLIIAYDNNTWSETCKILPELQLNYFVRILHRYLTIYADNLSNMVESYYRRNENTNTFIQKSISADYKWQDVYMHLHLICNKLQLTHDHILSVLEDTEINIVPGAVNLPPLESTIQKLNIAHKEVDAVRSFIEFAILLIANTKQSVASNEPALTATLGNSVSCDANEESFTLIDSDPEIVDEVFEAYITNEYLRPLYEEGTESVSENYKWDKLLAKTFMTELKDTLVVQKNLMSERESKARLHMYRNMTKVSDNKTTDEISQQIPPPPPMPDWGKVNELLCGPDTNVTKHCDRKTISETSQRIPVPPPMPDSGKVCRLSCEIDTINGKLDFAKSDVTSFGNRACRKRNETVTFTPLAEIKSDNSGLMNFSQGLPSFLKANEETFIGSGENSEEESSDNAANEEIVS